MFENINPADTRDIVGRFPLSNRDDVNAAVNAAQGAFDPLAQHSRAETRGIALPPRRDPDPQQGTVHRAT